MKRSSLAALGLFALGMIPGAMHAQTLGATQLTVDLSPANPAPYQTVTITPDSTVLNLSASTVTISVNGTVIATGSGTQSATYTVGPAGEVDTIEVSVSGPDGDTSASATISVAGVALVLEPTSITHPFYEGGALIAPQGRVRLIAIPDFRTSPSSAPIAAGNLVYNWKSGDQILQADSGIGKSILIAEAPLQYRDTTVSVTVSTQDGSIVGSAEAPISPVSPSVAIYEDSPLLGPDFDTAVGDTLTMEGDEETLLAVPYYFPAMPNLSWSVNGTVSGYDPSITVRATGQGAGTAALSLLASEPDSYQSANQLVTVYFGEQGSGNNLFGL